MPATITHYEFIKSLAKHDKYFDVLALAGQGPDPFFFFGYNFKKREDTKEIRDFGTLLHHIDIAPIYNFMIKYAISKSGEEKEVLLAYVRGFMYHYCLDRNTHPYIFYISGFSDDEKEKRKYFLEHAKVEASIDALVYKKCKETKSLKHMINVKDSHLKIISKMFYFLGKKHFSIDYVKEDSFYLAVKDMCLVNRILNSPLKVKKLFFMIFFKNHELNIMSGPLKLNSLKKYDLFNSSKQKWLNCVNGNIRFESFYELFDNAKSDAAVVNEIMTKAHDGEDVFKDLEKFTHNIDHDGFTVGAHKKYFKLIMSK
ncbi:MAG: hypothetical protein J1F32_07085 [Erysipelotrichales bacterium]|nr:hypothetical protein [Erysipelotrichales bacterium]